MKRETLIGAVTLALVSAACGGGEPTGGGGGGGGGGGSDLAAACGDRVVIQTDWFPEAEHAAAYQLAGVGGEIDKNTGVYTNEIGDTGVTMEIRSGGPFVGFQPDVSLIYQDPSVDLGFVDMDDAIANSATQPVKGIVSVMNKTPLMLMWDPGTYQFDDFADIGESDATVLFFEGSDVYIKYLVRQGWLREDQLDGSYDGSPARFVSERTVVQQGFVTNEVYKYEHDIEEWKKPVDYFLIHDSGFEVYPQLYAATPEKIEERRDCFELLVPMLQQAQVDYMNDPGPVNQELVRIVETQDTFWVLSEELNEEAHRLMTELELVSNENNDTLGDYETDRVQRMIDLLAPIFEEDGLDTWDPEVTPEDIVTNEFIDPSIGL
jgi:hypothetical protein